MRNSVTKQELMSAIHPNEDSRFAIALLFGIPGVIIAAVILLSPFILFLILIVFMYWLVLTIAKYNLMANAVKVSENNFAEIYQTVEEVRNLLDYQKSVPVFIIEEGSVNAFFAKFFRIKFIILSSRLAESMTNENIIQMKWIITRFIGSLKTRQFKEELLMFIFNSIESLQVFNFFLLPFSRATQYSGDNIGLLVCEDLDEVILAFNKLMLGKHLAKDINFKGLLEQGQEIEGSVFTFLARMGSTHPHMINRYLNLLAFAERKFPDQFIKYTKAFDQSTLITIGKLLPKHYSK